MDRDSYISKELNLKFFIGDEREFDELARDLGVNVEVVEPEDFFERVNKLLGRNSAMDEYIKQIIEYESDRRWALDDPTAFYVPFVSGKRDIARSKKLAHFIPNIYPSKIIPSLDILRNDLTLAKKTGIFDKYQIKYKN